MLFDNSQLVRVYLHAWQMTGHEFFRTATEENLDYVMREMLDPDGGFYSAQDADSEGEEGKVFVWAPGEIRDVLGTEADQLIEVYGVKAGGNWEGKNILELKGTLEQRKELADARAKLFAALEKRVHPGRDEKVLGAWNGLMLVAFAEAARALDRDDGSRALAASHREVAERNAVFLLCELRQGNVRLLRTWKRRPERVLEGPAEGAGEAKLNGYLEDYNGLYDTSDDHETLITRPRDLPDNATPSGNAMAVTALLKLAGFTNDLRYVDIAIEAFAQMQPMMAQYLLGFGQWLKSLLYALSKPREIAVVGEPDTADTQALLSVVRDGYRPFQVVAVGAPDAQPAAVPLLQDRGLVERHAAAYMCRDFACKTLVTEPLALWVHLKHR